MGDSIKNNYDPFGFFQPGASRQPENDGLGLDINPFGKIALDAMSGLVLFMDINLRVVWANRAAGSSVGLSPASLEGNPCYDYWGRGQEPCQDCPIRQQESCISPPGVDRLHPDGRIRHCVIHPVGDLQGRHSGYILVATDVTAQKMMEEARLETTRLRGAIDLASSLAHELSQPLQAVMGYMELLEDRVGRTDPGRAYLDKISFQLDRLKSGVNRLQETALRPARNLKPESGRNTIFGKEGRA